MKLTIYRGTQQIGGCVTELRTEKSRIIIDYGTELPALDGTQQPETLTVSGVSEGIPDCDGVLFTHYHGDHMGNLGRILPGIPVYMGEGTKKISLVLNRRLQAAHEAMPGKLPDRSAELGALERAKPLSDRKTLQVGAFRFTPYRVDHSAFDAYMFLIEAEGQRLLHTGDFRGHGYTGAALDEILREIGQVDGIIIEGTMVSREAETVLTEQELEKRAKQLMGENERVFVLCSSTNIDRLRAFYRAKPKERPGVCDLYQKCVLNAAEECDPTGGAYNFRYVIPELPWNHKLHDWMEERGFLMFVRVNDFFKKTMEPYRGSCKVVYSMWDGYLQNPRIAAFLQGYEVVKLHTSGHAETRTIQRVCEALNPRVVIPIHTELPGKFEALLPGKRILLPQDGETIDL